MHLKETISEPWLPCGWIVILETSSDAVERRSELAFLHPTVSGFSGPDYLRQDVCDDPQKNRHYALSFALVA